MNNELYIEHRNTANIFTIYDNNEFLLFFGNVCLDSKLFLKLLLELDIDCTSTKTKSLHPVDC